LARMKGVAAAGLVVWSACALAQSPQSPNAKLREAQIFYDELEFEQCIQRAAAAPRPESSANELAQAELYNGLCQASLGRFKDAEDHFRIALRLDPSISLPRMTSPKVAAIYNKTRDRVLERDVARLETAGKASTTPTPADAPIESAHENSPRRLPWLSVTLGALGIASAGTTGYFGVGAKNYENLANNAAYDSDRSSLGQAAKRDALLANIALGVAAASLAGAVISFVVTRT
jgi:tetratricopeptide (TPR) repeat protein